MTMKKGGLTRLERFMARTAAQRVAARVAGAAKIENRLTVPAN